MTETSRRFSLFRKARQQERFTRGRHRWATAHNILRRSGAQRECNFSVPGRAGWETKYYDRGIEMLCYENMPDRVIVPRREFVTVFHITNDGHYIVQNI